MITSGAPNDRTDPCHAALHILYTLNTPIARYFPVDSARYKIFLQFNGNILSQFRTITYLVARTLPLYVMVRYQRAPEVIGLFGDFRN